MYLPKLEMDEDVKDDKRIDTAFETLISKRGILLLLKLQQWKAPELFQNGQISDKTDIWQFGVLLMEMCGTDLRANKLPTKYSTEFKDFLLKCLTEDPKERPTAQQLLENTFICNYPQNEEEFQKHLSNFLQLSTKFLVKKDNAVGMISSDETVHRVLQEEMKNVFVNFVETLVKPLQNQNSHLQSILNEVIKQNAVLQQEFLKLKEDIQSLKTNNKL